MNRQAEIISDYCSREPVPSRCAAPKHPFVEFRREELEQSIPSRFEQQVAKYPERIAVKTKNCSVTYTALNQAARWKVDSEEVFVREDLLRSTGRAMKSYIPRRYAGRVVLFQPSEENPDGAEDPTMGWSRVASAIEVQMVPRGHIRCVSTQVKVLADQMKACLDKADATKSKLSG